MPTVEVIEGEAQLSRLVQTIESGAEREIIIARDGKPAARLVPVEPNVSPARRLGRLAGRYPAVSLPDFDADNDEVAKLFNGPAD